MAKDSVHRPPHPDNGRLSEAFSYLVFTMRRFYNDGMMQSVGALTYSTLLAIVPLLVIAFSIFSAFPAFDTVQDRLQELVYDNILPETEEDLRSYLESFTSNASDLTVIGVAALAVSALLLLSTIEATLNTIWRVERQRPIVYRFLTFWALLTLGPLLLGVSLTASSDSLALLRDLMGTRSGVAVPQWLGTLIATVVQIVAFTAIFKLVPARPVRLTDAAIGGAVGGIGFELLKWSFQLYLGSGSTYTTVYGAVSAVPIFLIWIYACWTVIILGAVFAASLPDWRHNREIGSDDTLTPAARLAAAISVLKALADQSRHGGGSVPYDRLAALVPLSERDALFEKLRIGGYLVETEQEGMALARDLLETSVLALACDLDLALGSGSKATEAPRELSETLGRLADAEGNILGRPLAELIG